MRVDLHTHILFGVDDGARTIEDSLALLNGESENGVDTVVFTPHFAPQNRNLDDFLARRASAFDALMASDRLPKDMEFVLGAEVRYSEYLANLEGLEQLCIGNTRYMLLELPYGAELNDKLLRAVERLPEEYGIVPVLAHVERYTAVLRDPRLLTAFHGIGCRLQMNAESLFPGISHLAARRLLKTGLIDFFASDCHNVNTRPPNLAAGYEALEKILGADAREKAEYKAQALLNNERWWE